MTMSSKLSKRYAVRLRAVGLPSQYLYPFLNKHTLKNAFKHVELLKV